DRGVVGLARQARRHAEAVEGYADAMQCHLGDFTEYAELRRRLKQAEADASRERAADRRRAVRGALSELRRGDVLAYRRGGGPAHAVVLQSGGSLDGPPLQVLTDERQLRSLTAADLPHGGENVGKVRVPKNFNPRNPAQRRDLASTLRNALAEGRLAQAGTARKKKAPAGPDEQIAELRRRLRAHPCHGCAEREDHARWANRWEKAKAEHEELLGRIER